jgi:hypothetical protein
MIDDEDRKMERSISPTELLRCMYWQTMNTVEYVELCHVQHCQPTANAVKLQLPQSQAKPHDMVHARTTPAGLRLTWIA